jgi:hypothetical protein
MTISLLPDDLKRKEEAEKQKAKNARLLPTFKMYVPEKQKESPANWAPVSSDKPQPAVAPKKVEPATPSKPIFSLSPKPVIPEPVKVADQPKENYNKQWPAPAFRKPEMPPVINKIARPVPLPPKPEIKFPLPANVEYKKDSRLHYPEEIKEDNKNGGRGVVRESADKFSEIKKSPPLSDYLKKDKTVVIETKQAPAEVNLLDKSYSDAVRKEFWMRVKSMVSILTLAVLFFAFVFVGMKFYTTSQVKKYDEMGVAIATAEEEIAIFHTASMQGVQLKDRALALENLLGKHLYWTKFFDFLERKTSSNVTYTNFVSGDNGEVVLMARASKYSDVAEQLFLFQGSDFISEVDVNAINLVNRKVGEQETQEVQFNVRLKLKDDSLMK